MEINAISKDQMILDIFEFIIGTIEKKDIQLLDYKTIGKFWKQKIILKMLFN
jgi:hypothetical protein